MQPADEENATLTFRQIEEIIGDELPKSARQHRSWWANDSTSHIQSQQWLEAGWRVSNIYMSEEIVVFTRMKEREKTYIDFFNQLLSDLTQVAQFPLRTSLSNNGRSWMTIAHIPTETAQVASLGFSFAHGKRFRVELYIDTGNEQKNKDIFDKLAVRKNAIELETDTELSWERLEGRRASRIACYHPGAITDKMERLDTLRTWAVDTMLRFQPVMERHVSEVINDL